MCGESFTRKLQALLLPLMLLSLLLSFQNCGMQKNFSEAPQSNSDFFATKEDFIFELIQEARALAIELQSYDVSNMVLTGDTEFDSDAENTENQTVSDRLNKEADALENMILVDNRPANANDTLAQVDVLLNTVSKGRDRVVSFQSLRRDFLLQTQIDDLSQQVSDNYDELKDEIGDVREDLEAYVKLADARFLSIEKEIDAINDRHKKLSDAFEKFMQEQEKKNMDLYNAIQMAKKALEEQLQEEIMKRKEMGIKLSNDMSKALADLAKELRDEINVKYQQALMATDLVKKQLEETEARLAKAIADGDAALADEIDKTKKALQLEMDQKLAALKKELMAKIEANSDAIAKMQDELAALDKRLSDQEGMNANLKAELEKQKTELMAMIQENTDQIAKLDMALKDLETDVEVTQLLVIELRNEMTASQEQQKRLAELQEKICQGSDDDAPDCIPVSEVQCDVMFYPQSAENTQCHTIITVVKNHDEAMSKLDALEAAHGKMLADLAQSFEDMNNRVTGLESAVGDLSNKVSSLDSKLMQLEESFESKFAAIDALLASHSEQIADILPRLSQVEGDVAALKRAVSEMGEVPAGLKEEILALIEKSQQEIREELDGKLAPINEQLEKINAKLEEMAIDIAVLQFNKSRGEIMDALEARVAFNSAWITRRFADVKRQFCHKKTRSSLHAFDYQSAKHSWVFCRQKLAVLNRARELNKISLAYIKSLGSINIDNSCSAVIKNSSGQDVNAALLEIKDYLDPEVLAEVQSECGHNGRPAAIALMVNIMKFLRMIGPDYRTYEYMGQMASAASAIILGAPYADMTSDRIAQFENLDPTSEKLAGTPYGIIERLFPNRYIESTFRMNHRANGDFPEAPGQIDQPKNLGLAFSHNSIASGSYIDPSYGTSFGQRLKELELSSPGLDFKVVARNRTKPGTSGRYTYPTDARSGMCPINDDVLVKHGSDWYAYHISYRHVHERFVPRLSRGNHMIIGKDDAATDDNFIRRHNNIVAQRAGLTLAKIPRRTVLRATRPYGKAYNRPSCVKFSLVGMLREGEWHYENGEQQTEDVQRNNLWRYLTGFSSEMIENTCSMQTYLKERYVKVQEKPIYKSRCYNPRGKEVSCGKVCVAETRVEVVGYETEEVIKVAVEDNLGRPILFDVGTMNTRNIADFNPGLRKSFSKDNGATQVAQSRVSLASTQLTENYWMWKDQSIKYTGQRVQFNSESPFVRSPDNRDKGLSGLDFIRELEVHNPIIVNECEHCEGNLSILGPCNKAVNKESDVLD